MKILQILPLLLLFFSSSAYCQIIDSASFAWTVYEMPDETDRQFKRCYMITHPTSSDTDHSWRKKPYIMITRFQKDRSEEVSVYGGYEFKLNGDILLLIDSYQFRLKGKSEIAWAKTRQEDIRIIETMLNASRVRIRSDSAIGTYAIDEYSLKGIAKAYARLKTICE